MRGREGLWRAGLGGVGRKKEKRRGSKGWGKRDALRKTKTEKKETQRQTNGKVKINSSGCTQHGAGWGPWDRGKGCVCVCTLKARTLLDEYTLHTQPHSNVIIKHKPLLWGKNTYW